MSAGEVDVAVVGGGAAGIAAARRLHAAGVACLLVEARPRLGGRAWTTTDRAGRALDLGCGWLHSADRNPWRRIAEAQGRTIDKTVPPWQRPSLTAGFPLADQHAFVAELQAFHARLGDAAARGDDAAAATELPEGGRWNGLINAVSSYISGAETDLVSIRDFDNYEDDGVNWRIVEGYGATVAAQAGDVPFALECPVHRIDHGGRRIRLETARGVIVADQVIVTLPSTVLAEERVVFAPALPAKVEAAAGLPLGLADKLFLSLADAEEFEADSRLFGRTDRAATGAYHMRPFGRPQIEAYFGGRLAHELEAAGERAFFDFAVSELTGLLGNGFARRIAPLRLHRWGSDPFARGSYSYARPGRTACRDMLAAPVDGRLFFAGEACSRHDFSTAHGAWHSGVAAAEQVIAVRKTAL